MSRCPVCDLPPCTTPDREDCGVGTCHRAYNASECDGNAIDWRSRALAAEAALANAVAHADAQIVSVARESEARGRAHGLLAAALQIEGDRLRCEDQAAALRAQNDPESDSNGRLAGRTL